MCVFERVRRIVCVECVCISMASLGTAPGTLTMRFGCDAFTSCRGPYIIPIRSSPPSKLFRVSAEAQRGSQGRMTKKNNALDVNAASRNASLHDTEVGSSNVGSSDEEVEKEKEKTAQIPLHQLLLQRLNLNKAMDELVGFMAPREKGDIRDVFLMSLSFAVLVYISQRLVCLYCVVRHMSVHNF